MLKAARWCVPRIMPMSMFSNHEGHKGTRKHTKFSLLPFLSGLWLSCKHETMKSRGCEVLFRRTLTLIQSPARMPPRAKRACVNHTIRAHDCRNYSDFIGIAM